MYLAGIVQNTCSLAEIAIPAMIVISSVLPGEDRYTVINFPPRRCENRENSIYTSIIPESTIAALGTVMLVIICWIIYKVYKTWLTC